MLNDMMKNNSHRVDYLNFKEAGTKGAIGIYVRGCLQKDQPYSMEAKRRLFLSLDFVRRNLEEEKLVAVYMDIVETKGKSPAFNKMDSDLREGLFEKVLFSDLEEIFNDISLNEKLFTLAEDVEGIEFIDVNGNVFEARKIPLNHILGV
ncbi:MAG TPA: hypothetical protein VK856_05875 [Anaerolineaceae bacterium]|nr:hypothetical protein [Anaerolineaceae bacterium]